MESWRDGVRGGTQEERVARPTQEHLCFLKKSIFWFLAISGHRVISE